MSYIQKFLKWTDLWSRNPPLIVYVKWLTHDPGTIQDLLCYVHAAQKEKDGKNTVKKACVFFTLSCSPVYTGRLSLHICLFLSHPGQSPHTRAQALTQCLVCSRNWHFQLHQTDMYKGHNRSECGDKILPILLPFKHAEN